jgi:hypothetical protein
MRIIAERKWLVIIAADSFTIDISAAALASG